MKSVLGRLSEIFSAERITDYLATKLIPDLVVAFITFLAFYLLWKALQRLMASFFKHLDVDQTAQRFVLTVVKYGIFIMGLVMALSQLGINVGSLIAGLGVAGLTIGFAAKDALSNVISGLFIFWDRPFVIGDLVEIGGQYGRVEEITMRSTRVITVDGKMLAIPNSQVLNTVVASYTNFPRLRLDVTVTVGPGEDLTRVRKILLALFEGDDRYMSEPAPEVVVGALNDYNVEMVVRAWLADERTHIPMRFELREKIFNALRNAHVEMPYETFEVHVKKSEDQ